ncbi:MAG: mannose-1-phosphate guanylyltransferase [Polyangiales bacterium]|nr:mannose-1-phosphate guanylyltransferase [Myxococcales bacterium]MCB9657028.1 NTP transferase domain-containing protein [Sandaracinaceae bacterium]
MSRTVYAVIMAGGSGTRFWPASRGSRPKQLLPLAGGELSLIAETVARIAPIVPAERVLVVTSELLADATAAELPAVPRENILAEPMGRNTAPCVGWAAAHVRRRDPDALMMVLPADHHIGEPDTYRTHLRTALAAADDGALVTVGIEPTRPETGYGYIERGASRAGGVHAVTRFVEKPTLERAEEFLASGHFLWNSGMFFFRADAVLAEIERQLPTLSQRLVEYDAAARESAAREREVVTATYGSLESVSFDHGIMENAERISVVSGSFGWSDLGSWTTAYELASKDGAGNAARPTDVLVDSIGCYVSAPSQKLVALVGVHDLVVVDTEDALLVMPRERAQDVRAVVDALKARDDPRA